MGDVFLWIVNQSISAVWLILAVLVLRLLLKRAPKWINGVLWGIVGLRLVLPFSVESALSLIPSAQTIAKPASAPRPYVDSGVTFLDDTVNGYLSGHYYEGVTRETGHFADATSMLALVWLAGLAAMLLYAAVSSLRLRRRIGTAVRVRENVYRSDRIGSPFVFGIFRPRIYLPYGISDADAQYVIAHERAHLCRRDHWWKPIGFLILSVYWFHPLVWVGYVLLCRDIELACDERVVSGLSDSQKADYSQALLTCSVNRRLVTVCPLAFGEVGVKDRVKKVLCYKKPAFWMIVLGILIIVSVAVCFLTNPPSNTLEKIEGNDFSSITHERTSVALLQGEEYRYVGAMEKRDLQALYGLRISRGEISQSRSEDRDRTNTVILNISVSPEPFEPSYSYIHGVYIHFNADFSSVWVDDGVKPTFSYRVLEPQKAKEVFSSFFGRGKDASSVGGADSGSVTEFESTVSWVNWSESDEIFLRARNTEKLAISSVKHLPIYKFDTLQEFDLFRETFGKIYSLDSSMVGIPSFSAVTAKYGAEFFSEHTLLLVYVSATSNSFRYRVHSIGHSESSVCVHVEQTAKSDVGDGAMAGWFLTVAVSDEYLEGRHEFDADLNNLPEDEWPKYTDSRGIERPPKLSVISNGISLNALRMTTSWSFRSGTGTVSSTESDTDHPLNLKEYVPVIEILSEDYPVLTSDRLSASLFFYESGSEPLNPVPPDSITVRRWDASDWGNSDARADSVSVTVSNGNFHIPLKDSSCIYEIVAVWNSHERFSGTVYYSFCTQ